MGEGKSRLGLGEILFGLVVVLGIVGTVSFFAFDDLLGEHRITFMIASSLAFIGSFFVLSLYTRAKKRAYLRRLGVKRAVANWSQYIEAAGRLGNEQQPLLQAGTLESIAMQTFAPEGHSLVSNSTGGFVRLANKAGEVVLIQCRYDPHPLALRDVIHFYEVFRAEKAALGEIWSPGGFHLDASHWVTKKPIRLRDAGDIHEAVEGLSEKKSASHPAW